MIVLVLQYYAGDRDQAAQLCKLIGDIEAKRRDDVCVRLVARFDCEHLDMASIQAIGKRFDVSWAKTEQHAVGWPAGPNMMAKQVLHGAKRWMLDNGWDCDGILMLEPDCVPLSRDWLDVLLAQWALAQSDGKKVMGSWRNSGGEHGHINGNCIVSAQCAATLASHINQYLAWDCAIAPYVRSKWHVTGAIRNDFQGTNATEALLRTPEIGDAPPVMSHGWKDGSAMQIARRWMNL